MPIGRKLREQTAEQAEVVRTPLPPSSAGDFAYSTVTKAVTDARTTATKRVEGVQSRVSEFPEEPGELRGSCPRTTCASRSRSSAPRSRASTSASPSAGAAPGAGSASSRRSSRPSRSSRTRPRSLTPASTASSTRPEAATKALDTVTTQTRSVVREGRPPHPVGRRPAAEADRGSAGRRERDRRGRRGRRHHPVDHCKAAAKTDLKITLVPRRRRPASRPPVAPAPPPPARGISRHRPVSRTTPRRSDDRRGGLPWARITGAPVTGARSPGTLASELLYVLDQ
ncbi:hypothetical protein HBB16_21300 [Pseudonocardia sp. MCCB 268]|nr:hypothetical protein [Pseudonocardia cytotoxica]